MEGMVKNNGKLMGKYEENKDIKVKKKIMDFKERYDMEI